MAEFDAGAGSGARIPRGDEEGRKSGKAGEPRPKRRHRSEDPTERIEARYDPDEDDEERELRRAKSLVSAAVDAREHAYAPYSRFKVGAAVVTEKGVFVGVNVENASYPLSVCAERNAIAAAVAAGARRLFAVAVVADAQSPIAPCGGCRQVLSEFGKSAKVYLSNLGGEIRTTTVRELLPHAFGRDDLGGAGA
jgi:cytidine deaminase